MIPKATCGAEDLVLPGAVHKWPLLEHDPECMLYRDPDPPHARVPSPLCVCQLPHPRMRAHKHGTHSIRGIPIQLKVLSLGWVSLHRTRLDGMFVHELG